MKAYLAVLALILVGAPIHSLSALEIQAPEVRAEARTLSESDRRLADAFKNGISEFRIKCKGVVIKKLADDLLDSRHQRFIVRLASGQTLLIAHNIDLAPRVANLRNWDAITIYGEYIWNSQGGLIHYTHRDPAGLAPSGWIKHRGKFYH